MSQTSDFSLCYSDEEPNIPASGDICPILSNNEVVVAIKQIVFVGEESVSANNNDMIYYEVDDVICKSLFKNIKSVLIRSAINFMLIGEKSVIYYNDTNGDIQTKLLERLRRKFTRNGIPSAYTTMFKNSFTLKLVNVVCKDTATMHFEKLVLKKTLCYKVITNSCELGLYINKYPNSIDSANVNYDYVSNIAKIKNGVYSSLALPDVDYYSFSWLIKSLKLGEIFIIEFKTNSAKVEEFKSYLVKNVVNISELRKIYNSSRWIIYFESIREKVKYKYIENGNLLEKIHPFANSYDCIFDSLFTEHSVIDYGIPDVCLLDFFIASNDTKARFFLLTYRCYNIPQLLQSCLLYAILSKNTNITFPQSNLEIFIALVELYKNEDKLVELQISEEKKLENILYDLLNNSASTNSKLFMLSKCLNKNLVNYYIVKVLKHIYEDLEVYCKDNSKIKFDENRINDCRLFDEFRESCFTTVPSYNCSIDEIIQQYEAKQLTDINMQYGTNAANIMIDIIKQNSKINVAINSFCYKEAEAYTCNIFDVYDNICFLLKKSISFRKPYQINTSNHMLRDCSKLIKKFINRRIDSKELNQVLDWMKLTEDEKQYTITKFEKVQKKDSLSESKLIDCLHHKIYLRLYEVQILADIILNDKLNSTHIINILAHLSKHSHYYSNIMEITAIKLHLDNDYSAAKKIINIYMNESKAESKLLIFILRLCNENEKKNNILYKDMFNGLFTNRKNSIKVMKNIK